MKQLRKVSRRSFLATVAGATGGVVFAGAGHAATSQGCTDSDPAPPRGDPGARGRNCTNRPQTGCSDSDSGSNGDPGGAGRNCSSQPQAGCSDSDSGRNGDPSGRGRRCQTQGPASGCSDRDPSDPTGRGRSCGGATGNAYVTGRRERRYEVCWSDRPDRSNCNWQTYSEWATDYSDGRVIYDTSEAMARRAEMERRGYHSNGYRLLQDW